MHDTRPPILRLTIHILMLVGLILILPEEPVSSEKTTMLDFPEPENVSQAVIPPQVKHTSSMTQAGNSTSRRI